MFLTMYGPTPAGSGSVVTVFSGYALVVGGQQTLDMVNHVGVCAAAVVLYPAAGRLAGVEGVAAVTSLLGAALGVLKVVQVDRCLGVRMWDRELLRTAILGLALAGACAAAWALGLTAHGWGRIACAAAGLALCAGLLPAALTAEDRSLLAAVSRRLRG